MGDRVRFVDSISDSPTVRLDLNDETKWAVRSRDFSPPPLRRTESRTMLGDGAHIGESSYDNRVLRLGLELVETNQDNLATETQKLARELDRDSNILEYRPTGATNSIFFRTFRASPQEIQDLIAAAAIRDHVVEIPAEPFGLGLREDLGTFPVSNAPDTTTNLVTNPSIEVDTTGWVAHLNCTIARSTAITPPVGVASLRMTASSAANMTASTLRGTSGIPATVGTVYSAQGWFRAVGLGRSCGVNIAWFNAAGSLLSTSVGTTVNDTSGFVQAVVTATAPANTAFAAVETAVTSPANGEAHDVDAIMLAAEGYASPYVDGTFRGRWTGTAHASTSVRNACYFDVSGIKGDVEAPLLLTYGGMVAGGSAYFGPQVAIAVRSGSPYPALFRQAESMTLGTDTSAVVDATFSGGSKARVSFATDNGLFTDRIVGKLPLSALPAGPEYRGVYRVFIRCRSSSVLNTYTLAFRSQQVLTVALNPYPTILDLGLIRTQTVAPNAPGYHSTPYDLNTSEDLNFGVRRDSGTDSFDIDYFLCIPADERFGIVNQAHGVVSTDQAVVDGPNDIVYSSAANLFTTPRLTWQNSVSFTGSLPYVKPGDNRIVFYQTYPADGSGVGSRITDYVSVTAHYWPRYLYVRPAAT